MIDSAGLRESMPTAADVSRVVELTSQQGGCGLPQISDISSSFTQVFEVYGRRRTHTEEESPCRFRGGSGYVSGEPRPPHRGPSFKVTEERRRRYGLLPSPREPIRKMQQSESVGRKTLTTKYACSPATAPRSEEPRLAPSPQTERLSVESPKLTSLDQLKELSGSGIQLARGIEERVVKSVEFLSEKLEFHSRDHELQLMTLAQADANHLRLEQLHLEARLKDLVATDGWSRCPNKVLNLYEDLCEMMKMLREVDTALSAPSRSLVLTGNGGYHAERDWCADRQRAFLSELYWFRRQVKRLPVPPQAPAAISTTICELE